MLHSSLISLFQQNLESLRAKIGNDKSEIVQIKRVLNWLAKKRKKSQAQAKLVTLSQLTDWCYKSTEGILRHRKGSNYFFSVQGVKVTKAEGREVDRWNQPILVQKEGGVLVILCQERQGKIQFLLQAKFEPGNISGIQLAPTIQATQSNLKRYHQGEKPRFSEYINHKKTKVVYSAQHNEEGSRFWKKSNINSLVLLDPKIQLPLKKDDDFIWLTFPQIKLLMLYNNIINPFVKTILSPL